MDKIDIDNNDNGNFMIRKSKKYYEFKSDKLVRVCSKDINYVKKIRDNFLKKITVYFSDHISEYEYSFLVEVFDKKKRFPKFVRMARNEAEKEAFRKIAFKRASNFLEKELTDPENFILF